MFATVKNNEIIEVSQISKEGMVEIHADNVYSARIKVFRLDEYTMISVARYLTVNNGIERMVDNLKWGINPKYHMSKVLFDLHKQELIDKLEIETRLIDYYDTL